MKLRPIMIATAAVVAVIVLAAQGSQQLAANEPAVASEQSTSVLHGDYVEVHASGSKGSSASEGAPEQWLRTADGRSYQLDRRAQVESGKRVRVEGTVQGNQVAVKSAVAATPAYTYTPTTGVTKSGVRSVLIMMVNWTRPDATTPATAQKQIAVTDNSWYKSVSAGRMGFSAKATPWMTLPKSDCSLATGGYWKILTAAQNQAKARGYDPKAYDHEMVYFPFDSKCNFGGLGTINDRVTWVNGEMSTRVTVHELGHNLGLQHSRSAVCVDSAGRQVALSTKCMTNDYGDLFDSMGVPTSGTPQFNAIQMNRLGWLTGHSTTVTTTRSVTLSPLENGAGIVAARILVGGNQYWLEYRRPAGVDSSLSASPGAVDGVLVHRVASDGGSDLLDQRPDSTKSFSNAALRAGATWKASAGLTMKVSSVTATRAVVAITVA